MENTWKLSYQIMTLLQDLIMRIVIVIVYYFMDKYPMKNLNRPQNHLEFLLQHLKVGVLAE